MTPTGSRRCLPPLGDQPGLASVNLRLLMSHVSPGMIREAYEMTYSAQVTLRVDIETPLIAGDISVEDVPARWDQRMQALLGIGMRGEHVRRPLQDIHWAQGIFGYFPAYLLGAMTAAQLAQAFRSGPSTHICAKGSIGVTEQLVEMAAGQPLPADALRDHLTQRCLA